MSVGNHAAVGCMANYIKRLLNMYVGMLHGQGCMVQLAPQTLHN